MSEVFVQHLVSLLAVVVVYSIICRAVKMGPHTMPSVRHAMAFQGVAAFALALVPWARSDAFEWCVFAFVVSCIAVQMVTAKYWRGGTPRDFDKRAQ